MIKYLFWLAAYGVGLSVWKQESGETVDKARILHPLFPFLVVAIVLASIFNQGVIGTWYDLKYAIATETVWW